MNDYQEQDIELVSGESKQITFHSEFPAPPVVTVSLARMAYGNDGVPYVSDLTAKGCIVHVWTPDLAPRSFNARVTAAMPGTYRTDIIADR